MRLEIGDTTFDSRLRSLRRGRQTIDLSPKAFLLLEMLIEARPAPVAKEDLYDRLWPKTFVEPGNLHNLISELRDALGDDDHSVIKTVRGFGYAFEGKGKVSDDVYFVAVVRGSVIRLEGGENIIGRDPAATICIDSPDVSRNHARILVLGSEVRVEDLDSKNGTFIGKERVTSARTISPGDDILIGSTAVITIRQVFPGETITNT